MKIRNEIDLNKSGCPVSHHVEKGEIQTGEPETSLALAHVDLVISISSNMLHPGRKPAQVRIGSRPKMNSHQVDPQRFILIRILID